MSDTPIFTRVPLPKSLASDRHTIDMLDKTTGRPDYIRINGWFTVSEAFALYGWLHRVLPDAGDAERYDCPIHGTGEGGDCPKC